MQNGAVTLEDIWAISYNIKCSLTIQSTNPYHTIQQSHSQYLLKGVERCIHEPAHGCFIVALVAVAQTWKQSRHSSVGE